MVPNGGSTAPQGAFACLRGALERKGGVVGSVEKGALNENLTHGP